MSKVTGSSLTPTANRLLAVAKAQVGYHEGHNSAGWDNIQKFSPAVPGLEWSQGQAWCATFCSWCAMEAKIANLVPRTASTDTAAAWYQARKQWSEYPAIGAQGFLANGTNEFHTFWVWAYDDTYIWTYEGNSNTNGSPQGDGVYSLQRRRRDAVVEGYGYPAYPEGIISADPAWAGHHPKAVAANKPTTSHAKEKPVSTAKGATITAASNNLMSLPVNPDILNTLKATPGASVIGIQEADLHQYKEVIDGLDDYTTHAIHPHNNTYDSFVLFKPSVWEHVSTEFVKTYSGAAKISYTRHAAATVLLHKSLGFKMGFISYHAVTAGQDKQRKKMRKAGTKAVRKIIHTFKKEGIPFVLLTDQNNKRNTFGSRDIHTLHNLDHQYAWNGKGVTLKRASSHLKKTRSDHDALVVKYQVTVK